ncbi:MAG TPA: bifunctional proline dehydrogenase/L-glutamate gamma-semialdehyde dehydrogenase PutA [Steroidobacteraceae bacterium]|nr:bifunctional proline dehydrogenase/L-glutamate gamma-semialdehyde dehydrogenase PutA [Steroidobacteraceae bacterium]
MNSPPFVVADGAALDTAVGAAINRLYLAPETGVVRTLADRARLAPDRREAVQNRALALVNAVRSAKPAGSGLDAFLREYHLGSREGVILMCLAEALLRIPDAETADRLIADKIPAGDWEEHLGDSDSLFVNASTWGLMLTGRIVDVDRAELGSVRSWFSRLTSRIGEPLARAALRQAMRILGHQFVMGRTIEEALERTHGSRERVYRYSFDMLGESALTAADAERYYEKYRAAIIAVGQDAQPNADIVARHSISVKLSALHPRYELAQRQRVMNELGPRLHALVKLARESGIGITVDAEEADRLELSLLLIDSVLASDVLDGYGGFGLAVQAYQRRAYNVLEWLASRARSLNRKITVRLVKGAYWDSEIKRAQERGLESYPTFTRKPNTDVSYLACARLLAGMTDVIYPQFATHNAHTVAYVAEVFGNQAGTFEYQRLHGMGEELYTQVIGPEQGGHACRVYAPVGPHEDLLPYLVRRLLENGANTSFVNRIVDARLPAEAVVMDPVAQVDGYQEIPHPRIVDPARLYGADRTNSRGVNMADGAELRALKQECEKAAAQRWHAAPLIDGKAITGEPVPIVSPANESHVVGTVVQASAEDAERALASAQVAQPAWDAIHAAQRAAILMRAADAFEAHRGDFIARCTLEAGKTLNDGIAEVREAVDFLRYYAVQARTEFGEEKVLVGPTGERNSLRLRGKGVFVCISPWNFPLAIFTGQVAAALAAGNAVIAKPAEQTPLTAALAVELLHEAGVPPQVLQFLPGEGGTVGAALTRDPRVAGVAFTGSTDTARLIERSLAARNAGIATLIAETGGLNAMIVDSSALPEQVVLDAVASGFNSAGQRCSALRVLLLQNEIAPRVLELLAGYMDELRIGDPALLATDVGPVIDRDALNMLQQHAERITAGAWHHRLKLPPDTRNGRFFAPLLVELPSLSALEREVFGPIVHVVRYRAADLDKVVDAVNALGYGLTLGVHTRIDATAQRIAARARVGNVYVNRNMIGAVVGVQPFGGMGLSGTGPKAGGPHYLHRFGTEQTITINTAAVGGNASLLSLAGD